MYIVRCQAHLKISLKYYLSPRKTKDKLIRSRLPTYQAVRLEQLPASKLQGCQPSERSQLVVTSTTDDPPPNQPKLPIEGPANSPNHPSAREPELTRKSAAYRVRQVTETQARRRVWWQADGQTTPACWMLTRPLCNPDDGAESPLGTACALASI